MRLTREGFTDEQFRWCFWGPTGGGSAESDAANRGGFSSGSSLKDNDRDDDSSDPIQLDRAIREFRTGMPTLTRDEALQQGNISPYRPSAVSFPQMKGGFIDRPERNFNLEMEFNAPTRFSGVQRPPTMGEKVEQYITRALGVNPALEKRVVGLDEEGMARTPTYQITSENPVMDFIGARINPFPLSFDTRTGIPLISDERYQVSRVDSPFGTSENIVSYADLQNQFTPPDDSYVIPPTMVAQRSAPTSLVPMGRAGVGRALDPSTAYNPFGGLLG